MKQGLNIRDVADAHQLIVLSNIESMNAALIKHGASPEDRLVLLRDVVIDQLKSLRSGTYTLAKIQSPFAKQISTGELSKTAPAFSPKGISEAPSSQESGN